MKAYTVISVTDRLISFIKKTNLVFVYEEFLKEKLLIDEIVRKLYEEDQREIERKMLAQKATKEYTEKTGLT